MWIWLKGIAENIKFQILSEVPPHSRHGAGKTTHMGKKPAPRNRAKFT
jgi:hypothetical protein